MSRTSILEHFTLLSIVLWVSILLATKIHWIINLYFIGSLFGLLIWIVDTHYHTLRLYKLFRQFTEMVESPLLERLRR